MSTARSTKSNLRKSFSQGIGWLLLTTMSSPLVAATLEQRVATGTDDAEERASGSMLLSSSDLELVFDGGGHQTVGMRFDDLGIPNGALIERAYIQFDVDETNSDPTSLTIQGEASDSAATFSSNSFNISARERTIAAVSWAPVAWNEKHAQGTDQQTPDLSAVVQEIVSRQGWSDGNALVFVITGTGERTAESYDGTPSAAPLLHVEYSGGMPVNQPPAADAGPDQIINQPTDSILLGDASAEDDGLPNSTLDLTWSVASAPSGAAVTFSPSSGELNPLATFSDIGTYVLTLTASDSVLEAADSVKITVLESGAVLTTLNQRVAAGFDDAEERSSGSVYLNSSDLELVFDSNGNQTIGIRFSDLDIPRGATIHQAYVQFDVDEASSDPTFLTIFSEDSDSAAAFESEAFDISSRPVGFASVSWEPPVWNTVHAQGVEQRTPNLSALIEQVVSRPGWENGNALALLISGSGERVAESYEGSPAAAPLLHVEYSGGLPDPSYDSWTDFDISFNGLDVGVDTQNLRLLVPLPPGFETLQNFSSMVAYAREGEGFGLAFASGPVVASGTSVDFQSIYYGSSVPVHLYKDGVPVATYTLVFTNLPVIELDAQTIVDEPKLPGSFGLASGEYAQNTGTLSMGIEFRGSTSQQFDKKSFSLELVEDNDPDDEMNVRLLQMRNDGDWLMDATYRDTAFVRNIVSHDLYNDMRPFAYIDSSGEQQGQATIRGRQVEAILNGSYHGTYILEERIDRKLLDLDKIDVPEDAQGNDLWDQVDFLNPDNGSVLYKADSNNATLYFPNNVSDDFEQKYPDIDDIVHWGPLEELAAFVNFSSDQEFAEEVASIVDMDSVVDYWLLTLITQNRDTLKKNYYLARNKTEKWFFVPWDYDATFGMLWDGSPYTTTSWWDPQKNNLIRRLSELPGTGFNAQVKVRWAELRGTLFTQQALMDRFTTYRADSVPIASETENARTRNFARWPDSGGEGVNNPELGTLDYLSDWIAGRIAFLDQQIMAQPD